MRQTDRQTERQRQTEKGACIKTIHHSPPKRDTSIVKRKKGEKKTASKSAGERERERERDREREREGGREREREREGERERERERVKQYGQASKHLKTIQTFGKPANISAAQIVSR